MFQTAEAQGRYWLEHHAHENSQMAQGNMLRLKDFKNFVAHRMFQYHHGHLSLPIIENVFRSSRKV
jgi:hypothetical protein